MPDRLNATVIEKVNVTDRHIRMTIRPDEPYRDFKCGQYVALGLPEGEVMVAQADCGRLIKRTYSIGSSPTVLDRLEFFFNIVPDGDLTSRLGRLKPGDRVYAAPKITGSFTLDGTPDDANLVLVATGTGVSPFISMLRTPSTWTAGRNVTLLYGVRHESEIAFEDEMVEWSRSHPFRYITTVTRPGEGWAGNRGRVQRFLESGDLPLDPARDHVFLCGNPEMVDEWITILESRGYRIHARKNPGNLHVEKFW